MGRSFSVCVVAVALGLLNNAALADSLYRCSDGTFTNKAERQCPPYEPKGIVRVQRGGESVKQPVPEVKSFDEGRGPKPVGR